MFGFDMGGLAAQIEEFKAYALKVVEAIEKNSADLAEIRKMLEEQKKVNSDD